MAYSAALLNTDKLASPILQVAHGFGIGEVLRFNGTIYVTAQADSEANSAVVGMVASIADADHFWITQVGKVTGLTTGPYVAGDLYYLSPSSAGELTSTKPTGAGEVEVPCFIADSTTSGYFSANVGDLIVAAGANTALSNLAAVAINTALLSAADNTLNFGAFNNRWADIYGTRYQTGHTIGNTYTLSGWDVDGAVSVDFFTVTAGNVPTAVLGSTVTATTQALNDNSTKVATTEYVNNVVKLGQTNVAANSNTTFTQDVDTNQYFKITFTSNCTLDFTFNSGLVQSMCVELINAGAFTVTLPGALEWAGGAAPTFTAAGTDIIVVWNNGDNVIRAALIGQDFS